MSDNKCYEDCKLVEELKALCIEKEKDIVILKEKIKELDSFLKESEEKRLKESLKESTEILEEMKQITLPEVIH